MLTGNADMFTIGSCRQLPWIHMSVQLGLILGTCATVHKVTFFFQHVKKHALIVKVLYFILDISNSQVLSYEDHALRIRGIYVK